MGYLGLITKTCSTCGIRKPPSDFHKARAPRGERSARGGHGVAAVCKMCRAEIRKPGILNDRKLTSDLAADGKKRCGSCKNVKQFSEFHTRKSSCDGLSYKCAECVKVYCRVWKKKNPNAFKEWVSTRKSEREEYWRAWYNANKSSRAASYAKWAKANPDIINALVAKRNAAKLKATPRWANKDAIRAIYAEAARLTRDTGIKHEVDHIYPLQSDVVCGLHCEANLQILTKVENIRKGNRIPARI